MRLTAQDLQTATASEPLTLDEEYTMQRSWRTDPDKLTFIVCLPRPDQSQMTQADSTAISRTDDSPERIIGDVNLFLVEDDEDEDTTLTGQTSLVGELEIMIARKDLQNSGYGMTVLLAFMQYIISHLDSICDEYCSQENGSPARLRYFRVKIGQENARSIRLFERLGFKRTTERANYFGELELRLPLERVRDVLAHAEKPLELEYRSV